MINYLFQDRQGHLWIATGDGLSRFDGVSFWHLTAADGLPHDNMLAVTETPDGALWFASHGLFSFSACGLCRYDGQTLAHYTAADGLPSDGVTNLWVAPDGRLWAFTLAGPAILSEDRFEPVAVPPGTSLPVILRAHQESAGPLWLSTIDGLWRYDGARFERLSPGDGGLDGGVWAVIADHRGSLWAGGVQGACTRAPGEGFQRVVFQTELETPFAAPILEDRDQGIWFGAFPRGVFRSQDGRAVAFAAAQGLPANRVSYGLLDQDGRVWLSFDGGGQARYLGDRLTHYTRNPGASDSSAPAAKSQGLPDPGCTFLRQDHQGRYWLGTAKGTCRWDGSTWETVLPTDNWHPALIDWLETLDGELWGVAHNGQVLSSPGGDEPWVERLPSPRSGHNNGSLAWAPPDGPGDIGGLWCANGSLSLHRCQASTWRTYTAADGLPPDPSRCVTADRHHARVYVGTSLGTVCYWDGQGFVLIDSGAAWGHRSILHLYVDRRHRLWIGIEGRGVYCWDGTTLQGYTSDQGLAANRVLRIGESQTGHLVFCTQGGGVSLYDGEVFQTLDQQAGLANEVVKDFLQDEQGRYWFATQDGITRYQPGTDRPVARLTEVLADRAVPAQPSGAAFPAIITVPVSQASVRFAFQATSLSAMTSSQLFRYRLEGKERDWTLTRARQVSYADLPLGRYTFTVEAIDPDLHYSDPVTQTLEVVPDPRAEAFAAVLRHGQRIGELVGCSLAALQLRAQLDTIAPYNTTVLLLGETGTGKGVAARYLHYHPQSPRNKGPLLELNCGAFSPDLLENELFGHEEGAYTGAGRRQPGKLEVIADGTLFLDEIGDLKPELQVRLLRLLEEKTYERLGGTETFTHTVRIIAGTNRDLPALVAAGQFRADLYHRLITYPVKLPPLRDRREDIPLLAEYFLDRYTREHHKTVTQITGPALALLKTNPWPGNIRDLAQAIERAVIACQHQRIEPQDLDNGLREPGARAPYDTSTELLTRAEAERRCLLAALEATDWIVAGPQGAARILDAKPSTVRDLIAKHGLQRPKE